MSRRSFRAWLWNLGYRLAGNRDGILVPPTKIFSANQTPEVAWFLRGGRMAFQAMKATLERNDVDPGSFRTVLDFGCGCGRVIQHWKPSPNTTLHGTDLAPHLIAWCQRRLDRVASFKVNSLTQPLDYPDETFDFVYALSVFTHLDETGQQRWIKELRRVLKTGGYLYFTTHGAIPSHALDEQYRSELRRNGFTVLRPELAGGIACGAFHSEEYIREKMAEGFECFEFTPNGARNSGQDITLFKKQPSRQEPE